MAGFDNDVMYATNVDFTGASPVTGQMTMNGQLLIGATVAPFIRANTLTAGSGISITNGAGTITITNTAGGGGGGGATSLAGNVGSAPNIAGVINVVGGTNITTTGDGIQTLTITPTLNLLGLAGLSGTGYVVRTGVSTFIERTFVAGSGISLTNASGVAGATTIAASPIVPTTFTEDAGSATPALNNINILGTSVQGISTSGAGSTVTITASDATSAQKGVAKFDATNFTVAAGNVTSNALTVTAGTGLTTGGSVNLGGSVTLALDVPVTVPHGGTGDITLTNHGVMLGQGTNPVVVTAAGTNGQVLIGATGADPAFATVGGTQGVTLTTGANSLSIGLVNVPNSALANSSITITGGTGISVSGSPVSLGGSVTISASGTTVTQFTSDSGVAIPSGNNINLLGTAAQGLSTSASGATVTFTNANATTTQKGVVALATNAETITGTDTAKAITADDLKAKLGAQTNHGFAIGAGTTNALSWTAAPTNGQLPIGSTGNDPVLATLTAGTGISITNGAGSITVTNTAPAAATYTVITKFTASGTWTKNAAAKTVEVYLWSGGGGGGSGRRGAAGTNRSGGGGGTSSGASYFSGPADLFDTSETVTIGAGGGGGAAQSSNDTNGIAGTSGGVTSLGNISTDNNGDVSRGGGGTTSSGSAGGAGLGWSQFSRTTLFNGGSGSNSTGGNGNDWPNTAGSGVVFTLAGGSAGGGGGLNTSNTAANGGNGGNFQSWVDAATTIRAGGTAGTVGVGQNGGNGNAPLTTGGMFGGGTGGGGGAANASAAAGNGGDGAAPGGGGGGGGASVNGQNSGAGGNGARGEIWVIEHL